MDAKRTYLRTALVAAILTGIEAPSITVEAELDSFIIMGRRKEVGKDIKERNSVNSS